MATHFVSNGGGVAGTNWQVPVQLSDPQNSIGYQYGGAVGMDAAGDAMAVYYSYDGANGFHVIYAVPFQQGVGWGAPSLIGEPYYYSYNPIVSMNAFGDAVVAWTLYTGSTYQIYSNHYIPGTGWSTAKPISGLTNYSFNPSVAIDGAGNAIATWTQYESGTYHIYVAHYSTTTGWAPGTLAETSTNFAYYSSAAMDPQGNGIVGWIEDDSFQYNVWAKFYVNTSGWAAPTNIKSSPYSAAFGQPAVSINKGSAVVVWTNPDATSTANVYANRYVAGSWVGEADIDGTASPAANGLVAIDPAGNITVTFQVAPTGTTPANTVFNEAVGFNHLTSTWSGASLLDFGRVGSGSPLLAIDGKGDAFTAWNFNENSSGSARYGILTNYYTFGSGWQPYYAAQQAEFDDQFSPSWLQLESNPVGDAIFSFTQNDGPITQGYAVLYTPATGWGPATRIENTTHSSVTEEWSAIDGAGNALVLFRQSDGTQYNVYAAYYQVGSGWGAPVRLDNAAGSNKFWLRVALNEQGNGVAAWQEYNGTNWNAYAALFNGTTKTWSAPTEVQSTYSYVGSVVVGIDGQGNAMTVFQAWNGSNYNNYGDLYKVGVGWQAPVQISHTSLSTGQAYFLEMNAAGYAAVSYVEWNGAHYLATASVFNPTTGWGPDTTFNSTGGDEGPAIPSVDAAGDALLAYNAWNGTQWIAYAATKPVGGAWGTPVQLSSGPGDAVGLATALDARGNGYAVWNQFNGLGYDTVARRYVSGSGWLSAAIVNQPAPAVPATDTGSSCIGTDGHGDAILGWNQWLDGALLPYGTEYIVGSGAPALTVSAPANGTLTNHSSVTVTGTTDPGASVTIDGASVAVASNGTFVATFVLPDGTHTFVVVAQNAGGLTTSASTSVTVDTASPGVTIATPISGSVTNNTVAQVTGTTEPGASVSVNGVQAVVTPLGAYSVAIALREGSNSITATATDPAGNSATATVTVTLDTVAPPLTVSSPTPGFTNHSTLTVAGTTEAGATISVDGTPVTVGGTGGYSTSVTLADGTHTIAVVATDPAGNRATVDVNVTVDTVPPPLTVSSPAPGLTNHSTLTVAGTSEAGATVSVDGTLVTVGLAGAFSTNVTLPDGPHTFDVVATDAAGNRATATVSVTVDSTPPPLALSSPAPGLTNHATLTVAGTTEAGATLTVDGAAVTVGGTGAFSTSVTLADGSHTIAVVATDTAGNHATVDVNVTVDTAPPALAFTSPSTGTTVSVPDVVVNGTAEVGATLVVNGYAVAVSGSGTFSVELPLSPGANTITATATDAAGNLATRTMTVTYDNPVPAAQSSITSLNTMADLLFGLVAASLAVGVAALILRPKKPSGPTGPPKEVTPAKGPASSGPAWEEK